MITLSGKSAVGGVAFGKMSFYEKKEEQVRRYTVEDVAGEIARYQAGKVIAIGQLGSLYEKAVEEVGEENAAIFQVHQMMLEDLDYHESIENIITSQEVNAEYAVAVTADNFYEMFKSMDDEYMKERAADVKDVSERLIKVLEGRETVDMTSNEPSIIAAQDLAPSETIQLDKSMVLAFLTREGSANSHTAILARTMNIPAIISMGDALKNEYSGREAIVDGFTGTVYIDPDAETIALMKEKQNADLEKRQLLQQLKGKENVTLDGKKIKIYANIGNTSDVGLVLKNDAGGIGLFRSEFLYLENNNFPTEDQQFQVYKTVAQNMGGKKVIVRTLDIGADKQADYFDLPKEENPALGYRAIRICLTQKDIFRTQLRALFRASVFGKIAIMFPMIISVEEVKEIKEFMEEIKNELRQEGIPFADNIETGIMIETPAAAMISDLLAKEVDFFSIGTNDLTQYTLAIDRQNPKLDKFYNAHHEAIVRMIKMVVDNGHAEGIWVGICGELGADLDMTETFLKLGVDELSVSPSMVLSVRKKVRETDVSKL
ncbi:phosphoenolpyruvate--protein phosphotransferase [Anaerobium acetethylicum]|uniref:Phosphoenolpyruvate-protein phosphotransferase n=1 Tax=Anaerobium acetethylicum TaxID=1619234 RepID=A0A1D3TQY6_9FIRM|nr:phosphoenolpyruvate--protein phosphotransferase [Anaerobium acetethylicum]SCP96065.1 phosphotransferase system, enzyme I, PtsI [Anaerobium acetethylicum]